MSGPLLVLFGVTPVNAPHAPDLPTVYIETSVTYHNETLRYERDCRKKAREAPLSKDKIIEPLGIKKT